LITLIPELKQRLSSLQNMFWHQLWPLLSSIGWAHCPATAASAEVFAPPAHHHQKARFRSIFDTLCYLSARVTPTTPTNVHLKTAITRYVSNLLEQRRVIVMVSLTAQQQASNCSSGTVAPAPAATGGKGTVRKDGKKKSMLQPSFLQISTKRKLSGDSNPQPRAKSTHKKQKTMSNDGPAATRQGFL